MKFKEKYTTAEKKSKDEKEKEKTELSNDAFAVGEMIEEIFNKLVAQHRLAALKG